MSSQITLYDSVGNPQVLTGDDIKNVNGTPVGSFLYFGGTTPPAGYLVCDGNTYLRSTYPDLYAAIGDLWANTNGATTPGVDSFRLPPSEVDGLGLYLRGDGANTSVGDYQADVFKEHDHKSILNLGTNLGVSGGGGPAIGDESQGHKLSLTTVGDITETRPRSITGLLCIKAYNSSFNTSNIDVSALVQEVSDLKTLINNSNSIFTAWVNFDPIGVTNGTYCPILSSHNIASVYKISTGTFTITFSTTMDNLHYGMLDGHQTTTGNMAGWDARLIDTTKGLDTTNIETVQNNDTVNEADVDKVTYLAFFGGKT